MVINTENYTGPVKRILTHIQHGRMLFFFPISSRARVVYTLSTTETGASNIQHVIER